MRITVGDISVPVGVKEWTSNYDSSIVWKQVGTKHKGIDRGIASDKISAEVTIRGVDTVVPAIRAMVLSAANNSTPIIIDCEIFETIFGPEFNYSDFTYECLVSEDDNDLSDSAGSTTVFSEWTFSVFPTCNMSERYLRDTGLFPNTLSINSAKRLDNGARILSSADSKNYLLGFGFSAPTCEIEYEGTLEEVAEAKVFLQKLRTNYFQFSADLVWPFEIGTTTVNVYCLDIDDGGPSDLALQRNTFTALFGLVT